MAEKKKNSTQAQEAAKSKKKKKKAADASKNGNAAKKAPAAPKAAPAVSPQILMGLICGVLLFLFCGMAFRPEGKVLQLMRDFLFGMFGKGAFYVTLPGLLFLAVSFVHKAKKNVKFKTRSVVLFILCYGVLHHLVVNNATVDTHGTAVVGEFFRQGITGASGGLICGIIGYLLRWAFGKVFSIILVTFLWLLALLGAMEITIPAILRAIRDRADAEGEGEEESPENPSERLVQYFADWSKRRSMRKKDWYRKRTDDEEAYDEFDEYDEYDSDCEFDDDDDEVSWAAPIQEFFSSRRKKAPKAASAPKAAPAPKSSRRKKKVRENKEEEKIEAAVPPTPPVTPPPVSREPFFDAELSDDPEVPPVQPDPAVRKVTANEAAASAQEVTREIEKNKNAPKVDYKYPPIDLLKAPGRSAGDGAAEMKRNSAMLNEALASFKIDAHIINVTRGPSITRYEVELDKGVRLNKLTGVADDIALSLGVTSVRIAPVPGKISVVGIEVPNQSVTTVALREVIDSKEFKASRSKSTFSVGKDIGGSCIVGNIAKMPHMLIAGTTGSGKSVCMNSIIISLLYKAAPEDVKLIMVDPKMVELGIYNDIPHLLIPVVTDPKKAAGSLQWAVTEMMRRYKMMYDAGVRDLESFNSIVESEEEGEKMPQVVIIIDELADLMLVAAKEVEDSICRIAQMGRAAGMHLIIATQRPSADVITGLMKANIPSRIAFSVASAMESRIILDTQGAEKLVGKGDMLYAPIGTGKPQRVQGCFVSDSEVEAVATYVKGNYKASYDESVMDEIEKTTLQTGKKSGSEPEANGEEMAGDEMLPQAVEVVFDTKQASVSMLQRRLKLGYARAARIMDEMEEKGIVGPSQGSKPRDILITRDQWNTLRCQLYPSLFARPEEDPVDLPF